MTILSAEQANMVAADIAAWGMMTRTSLNFDRMFS